MSAEPRAPGQGPARVLAQHRPSRTPPAGVIPLTRDQPPVPGEQRRRGHGEHLTPAVPGNQPPQRRERKPVTRPVADPADLAAQHRVLVPQDQQFGVLGYLTAGQHHQAAEHASQDQVDDREDHPAMIPVRRPARSSNRASRDGRESNSAGQSCGRDSRHAQGRPGVDPRTMRVGFGTTRLPRRWPWRDQGYCPATAAPAGCVRLRAQAR